ncbi:tRNA glutamyl-Q(34) synthetase GluQRS [Pseudooctadecabacter jejudonensis]|uniref:Glutamate--tRNA ligase n=1 Tax=Pseudooctadecabacter jejudonensis TaxID=1391910 RepID=A0A1Y5RI07_9RHOB|nr:tRNA glutamyl-Q(34) synthetase GluQRS [Pseudooctadecabacter jejudonensis]SLN16753.1 Glutamate--tRNA ligase [Pseudooctadecabacter jejudonensis]
MITRFAPSPTGPLHLGHAYSAILAHDMAQAAGGTFLLRIEDIDQTRARPEWEDQIYNDLEWLGLSWDTPVLRQSDRLEAYQARLDALWNDGLAFACTCTRRDVMAALAAPQEGMLVLAGPDGPIYPGTCRDNDKTGGTGHRPDDAAIRLAMHHVADRMPDQLIFTETGTGPQGETGPITVTRREAQDTIGDFVLSRRDMGTSYHLSVVLDDAAQGVTHVVRGQDLFEATKIHIILQSLLGLPTPIYHHHTLIRDDAGKRLAKRDDARALRTYRAEGLSPADIRQMVGLPLSSDPKKSRRRP